MLHSAHPLAVCPHRSPADDPAEFSQWSGERPARFFRSAVGRALATIGLAVVFAFPLAHLELRPFAPEPSAPPEWTEPVYVQVAGDHFELCPWSSPSHRSQADWTCCSRPVSVRLLGNGRVLPWQDGDFLDCMLHPASEAPLTSRPSSAGMRR